MNSISKFDKTYMKMAETFSELSSAKRKQVGCLIVKDRQIISEGYNGTPSGMDNTCEDENFMTHWYVLHAEANALMKLAKSTASSEGATLYTTYSPCKECAKLIHQSGIQTVFYKEEYKDTTGIDFLKNLNINVIHLP